jgi:hypothetical protein
MHGSACRLVFDNHGCRTGAQSREQNASGLRVKFAGRFFLRFFAMVCHAKWQKGASSSSNGKAASKRHLKDFA